MKTGPYLQACVSLSSGRFKEAEFILRSVLVEDDGFIDAKLALGKALEGQRRYVHHLHFVVLN